MLLAKQAASIHRIAEGRFALGMAVGGREDDFEAAGKDFSNRGQRFDAQLQDLHSLWRGEGVSGSGNASVPSPGEPLRVMIGGPVMRRSSARFAGRRAGHRVAGGLTWRRVSPGESGKRGSNLVGKETRGWWRLPTSLSASAEAGIRSYLGDYYAFLGEWVNAMIQSTPATEGAVRESVSKFEDAGIDELIFDPTIGDPDQIDRLSDVVL